jgi:hypothetical protein
MYNSKVSPTANFKPPDSSYSSTSNCSSQPANRLSDSADNAAVIEYDEKWDVLFHSLRRPNCVNLITKFQMFQARNPWVAARPIPGFRDWKMGHDPGIRNPDPELNSLLPIYLALSVNCWSKFWLWQSLTHVDQSSCLSWNRIARYKLTDASNSHFLFSCVN